MEEALMYETMCKARVYKGNVTTADMIGNKEKSMEVFRDILDRAYAKKCRRLEVSFKVAVDEAPMFTYTIEEYAL